LDFEDGEESGEDADDGSEVVASSDEGDDANEYKQDVENTLKSTGQNLKRGKTMAMKEAISTAKKFGVETKVITAAEKQLEDHKKQQRRDSVEQEVSQFFESKASQEIPLCDKMLKKAAEAECGDEILKKLKDRLLLLNETRPLETQETEHAREYLKQSCRNFVLSVVKGDGRPTVFLSLDDGRKLSANVLLDATMQNLQVVLDDNQVLKAPVMSLSACPATQDARVKGSRGFNAVDEDEVDCALALKHEIGGKAGVWCVLERDNLARDRLIEAVVILATACR